MAASALPKPGSKYGPCETDCEHRDCAATREMADHNCVGCGDKIGYEIRFYRDDDGDLIHMVCAEENIGGQ
jgi:hypothetical protein